MDSQHENYILGRDGCESKRLDEQHEFLKAIFRDTLVDPSIPLSSTLSVADEPRLFHGFDISDAQFPAVRYDGFKFTVHDVLQPFPPEEHGRYDLVHVRFLIAALKEEEYARAASNLFTLLKPGGYLQWVEIDKRGTSIAEPPVLKEICRILDGAIIRHGGSLQAARSVHDGVTAAGLQNVRTTYHKPGPELHERAIQRGEKAVRALLPYSLLKLGEVDSMAAATQRTGEIVDIYMRECPEWGTVIARYVCVVGQKAN